MTLSTTPTQPGVRARRPRRIAADEAHAWARNLRLGNPYAKLVLSMLTLYVDGAGSCFVGIEALAEDTELSTDTVRKRLAWLEQVGVIVRLPQWVDGNGRRNSDTRGKRTSDEIRLLLNADIDVIEARAAGEDVSENAAETSEITPSPQQGQQTENIAAGPRPALSQPSHSSKGLISEPEPEQRRFPPTPQRGEDSSDSENSSEAEQASEAQPPWPHGESWQRFETAWREPILHQSICRQIWSALTDTEREQAIKVARGYVAWRAGQKRPPNVCNAQKILRERDAWPQYAALAPAEPAAPKPKTEILAGTAEFAALVLCRAIARLAPIPAHVGRVTINGDPPAGAEGLAALARFEGDGNEVLQDGWTIAPKGSDRYIAWCQRVKEWIGHWPEDHRFWLDENDNVVANAAAAYREPGRLPKSKDGLLMPPGDWPPPKGVVKSESDQQQQKAG